MPTPGQPGTSEEPDGPAEPPNPAPLFERSDFAELFEVPGAKDRGAGTAVSGPAPPPPVPPPAPPPVPPSPAAWGTQPDAGVDVERLGPIPLSAAGEAPGIVLTPGHLTLLTVAGILLLAVVFGAGVLVGKFLLAGS